LQVESPEDGVDDSVHAVHIDKAHHGPGPSAHFYKAVLHQPLKKICFAWEAGVRQLFPVSTAWYSRVSIAALLRLFAKHPKEFWNPITVQRVKLRSPDGSEALSECEACGIYLQR
jgi:hypothetical protein